MMTATRTTYPGSVVIATTSEHPTPDRWFAQVGGRWVNPLGQHCLTYELSVVAVIHDADPDAEVNHR